MKKRLLSVAVLLAAAGCVTEESPAEDDGANAPTIPVLDDSTQIAQAELSRRVSYLASDELAGRAPGSPGGQAARAFLIQELTACGVEPLVNGSFEQPITGGAGVNVLGIVRGADPARAGRHVLIGAHYDHLGQIGGATYHGADDNAAGASLALSVACAIAAEPQPRSVIIAHWDAEEPPTFLSDRMGSQFYSLNPVVPLDQIDVAVTLDLVGGDLWNGYGGHFYLGAELSPEVAAAVDAAPVPEGLMLFRGGLHLAEEQPLGIGRQPWSDYDAFRNAGRPVLFLSNGQNKRYHTPADTVDMLNLPKMALEARYLLRVVSRLAHAEVDPTFNVAGIDFAGDGDTVKAVLEAALAPGGLVESLGLTPASRAKLEGDLADTTAIQAKAAGGATLDEAEVRRLRDGTQRIMCLAGSVYTEDLCSLF
jgi:hypothetical protein